jgi:5'(3')-deoxyribonucleotidase
MKHINTIYLDMDGVVADWNRGVADILGYTREDPNAHYPNADWAKIKSNERMYLNLPVMKDAQKLVDLATVFRDQLNWRLLFLSAAPKGNDVPWAFWDKCMWAQKNFPGIPVHFGPFAKDKQVHCKPGDILVDDRNSNITEWRKAGGLGIEVFTGRYDEAVEELKTVLIKNQIRQLVD